MFSFYLISSSNSFRYFKEEILNRAVENQTNLKQNLEKIGEGISNKKNKLLKQKYNKKKA